MTIPFAPFWRSHRVKPWAGAVTRAPRRRQRLLPAADRVRRFGIVFSGIVLGGPRLGAKHGWGGKHRWCGNTAGAEERASLAGSWALSGTPAGAAAPWGGGPTGAQLDGSRDLAPIWALHLKFEAGESPPDCGPAA